MKNADDFIKNRNIASYATGFFKKKIDKPWGYEIHLCEESMPYMMKIIHVEEGKRLSLQVHDEKQETYTLHDGEMSVLLENNKGEMEEVLLQPGTGLSVMIGQKHRIVGGKGGGTIIECSTKESGITFRLEDDYKRNNEDAAARASRKVLE